MELRSSRMAYKLGDTSGSLRIPRQAGHPWETVPPSHQKRSALDWSNLAGRVSRFHLRGEI